MEHSIHPKHGVSFDQVHLMPKQTGQAKPSAARLRQQRANPSSPEDMEAMNQRITQLSRERDLLRVENTKLQEENEVLKNHILPLIEQLQAYSGKINWEVLPLEIYHKLKSFQTQIDFRSVYDKLPDRFTIEDLLAVSEQENVNVFAAYDELKKLIKTGEVDLMGNIFIKK